MTKPTIESVLEELKKNLGEEAVEDILAEQELGNSLGFKVAGRRAMPGNAPELNPEKQARIEKTGEIGMALTPLGRGIGAGIQAAKNLGANVVKGFTGSSRNVTRSLSGSGQFAAPGAASKAGEAAGKAAANPTVQKGTAAAGVAAGVGVAASTADKDEKSELKADATGSGARKDMPGFKPQREPTGDDLYRDKGSQANAPETKSEPSAPVASKPQAPVTSTAPKPAAPSAPVPPPAPRRDSVGQLKPAAPGMRTQGNNAPVDMKTQGNNAPTNMKPQGNFSTNNDSPYGFARPGSDDDTAANFFSSDARMRAAQKSSAMNESKEEKNFDQFVKKFIKEQR
jgi:hypothetical protein